MTQMDERILRRLQETRDERELAEKMHIVQLYGDDDYPDGTVFRFTKHYEAQQGLPEGDYTYVVLKVGQRWYLTGRLGRQVLTWDTLRVFWVTGTPVTDIQVLAEAALRSPTSHANFKRWRSGTPVAYAADPAVTAADIARGRERAERFH